MKPIILFLLLINLGVVGILHSQIHSPQILNGFPPEYSYERVDFNNDGRKDLFYYDKFRDSLNVYDYKNLTATLISRKIIADANSTKLVDIDHNGYPEVLYSSNNTLGYYKNNNGTLGIDVPIGIGSEQGILSVFARDLDNDADADIVIQLSDYKLYIIKNEDGEFNFFTRKVITDSFESSGSIAFCDYNQDGNMDILFNHPYRGIHVVLNTGNGQYATSRISDKLSYVTYGIDDFNGDGFPEIVHLTYSGSADIPYGAVEIFQNPYGECCSAYYEAGLWYPSDMVIRDIDPDSDPEILICDETSFTLFNINDNQEIVKETIFGGTQDTVFLQNSTKIDIDNFDEDSNLEIIQVVWTEKPKIYQTDIYGSPIHVYSCDNIPNPSKCPPGEIVIRSNSDIATFNFQYPTCKELNSNLIIENTSVTNLSGLNEIRKIKGSLYFRDTSFDTIRGLEIVYVRDHLVVENNLKLINLDLKALAYARSGLTISNNEKLTNINSFENLEEASEVIISENPVLTKIRGFVKLHGTEKIHFINNPILDSIHGFEKVNGDLLFNNTPIKYMEAFRAPASLSILNSYYEDLSPFSFVRTGRLNLINVQGITSLAELNHDEQWDFYIENCSDLERIGFPAKVRNFESINNNLLYDLSGLNTIQPLLSNVRIINNPSLVSLNGFEHSTNFNGVYVLINNTALADISAVNPSIEFVDSINIINNPILSTCHNDFVCSYILSGKPFTITGNFEQCESAANVSLACEMVSTEDISQSITSIYPNPVHDELVIDTKETNSTGILYTSTGQLVLVQDQIARISFSKLPPGLYYLKTVSAQGASIHQIIKI